MKRGPTIILASKSPRRRALLKQLGIRFKVMPSGVDETSTEKRPARLVQELALRKAQAVAKQHAGLIIGADTLVVLEQEIFGQPKDSRRAYEMLYRLSGTTHSVFTGVALVDSQTGRARSAVAESRVRMKRLSVDALLALARKHLDKAGAYAIQEQDDPIARVVKGSYDNVVGLPLKTVKRLLQSFGVKLSPAPLRKPRRGV